ncbi:MAG: hypothetical protein IJ976_03470 [Alistipes sp.]|nr:hypothetical protein [Alistipes sp.]
MGVRLETTTLRAICRAKLGEKPPQATTARRAMTIPVEVLECRASIGYGEAVHSATARCSIA